MTEKSLQVKILQWVFLVHGVGQLILNPLNWFVSNIFLILHVILTLSSLVTSFGLFKRNKTLTFTGLVAFVTSFILLSSVFALSFLGLRVKFDGAAFVGLLFLVESPILIILTAFSVFLLFSLSKNKI